MQADTIPPKYKLAADLATFEGWTNIHIVKSMGSEVAIGIPPDVLTERAIPTPDTSDADCMALIWRMTQKIYLMTINRSSVEVRPGMFGKSYFYQHDGTPEGKRLAVATCVRDALRAIKEAT